jgi:leucyl-tRNA synthetase
MVDENFDLPVQVNGKLRAVISVPTDASREQIQTLVLADEKVQGFTSGKNIVKEIYVPNKIYTIVVK